MMRPISANNMARSIVDTQAKLRAVSPAAEAKVPSAAAVSLGGRALSKLMKTSRTRKLLKAIDRRKKRGSA